VEGRQRASERITHEVSSWPGITARPGRRGEFAFRWADEDVEEVIALMRLNYERIVARDDGRVDASA
jgi:hypothetical protein